jgi:hypothetical protein
LTLRKAGALEARQRYSMPPFLYQCPNTGFRVQGWAADDDPVTTGDVGVKCLACGWWHFVNPKTGRGLDEKGK